MSGQFKGRSIALCLPGEVYRREWVHSSLFLFANLLRHFESVDPVFHYDSNVYATRTELAAHVLKLNPRPYYILWLDDDNLITWEQLCRLILGLDSGLADVIAGWCWRKSPDPRMPVAPYVSCGSLGGEGGATPWHFRELAAGSLDVKRVGWTGFPAVLMRSETLARIPVPFRPVLAEGPRGFLSEDISFCVTAGLKDVRIAVDRRVKVPHLKLSAGDPPGFQGFEFAEQSAESEDAA